jgi:hypothetical protein
MRKRTLLVAVLMAVLVLGVVAYATADTTASDTVDVKAQANAKLLLTVSTSTVDFGLQDPGIAATKAGVQLVTVNSNTKFVLDATIVDPYNSAEPIGLTKVIPNTQNVVKNLTGIYTFTDGYTVNIPWSADPALPGAARVTYTATQN